MKTISKEQFCCHIRELETGMYRYALGMLRNSHDAEDAVGETVLKAWANRSRLKDPDRFRAWLFAILANQTQTILRQRGRMAPVEDVEWYEKQAYETDRELWRIVLELPAKFRDVAILYYYEGFSAKEIAVMQELSEGTVKSRLSRAREKLKRILKEDA